MSVEHNNGYLEPNRQLSVAAKINRICEANPQNFNVHLLLPQAYDVIAALDPIVTSSDRVQVQLVHKKSGESRVSAGATGNGNVSTSFNTEQDQEYSLGRKEYRIGGYVAVKTELDDLHHSLTFEPFWGRGGANIALGKIPPATNIVYHIGTHPIIEAIIISSYTSHSFRFGRREIQIYRPHPEVIYQGPLGNPRARDKGLSRRPMI